MPWTLNSYLCLLKNLLKQEDIEDYLQYFDECINWKKHYCYQCLKILNYITGQKILKLSKDFKYLIEFTLKNIKYYFI